MAKKEKIVIRYDGPVLSNHEMDVHELGWHAIYNSKKKMIILITQVKKNISLLVSVLPVYATIIS